MALILAAAACEGREEESLKGEILRGRLVMAAERDHERLDGTRNGFDEDLSSAEGVGVWERLTGLEGVGGEESDKAADHVDLGGHGGELNGGDEKRDETDELLLFRSVANGKENGGLVLDEGIDDSRMEKETRCYS